MCLKWMLQKPLSLALLLLLEAREHRVNKPELAGGRMAGPTEERDTHWWAVCEAQMCERGHSRSAGLSQPAADHRPMREPAWTRTDSQLTEL